MSQGADRANGSTFLFSLSSSSPRRTTNLNDRNDKKPAAASLLDAIRRYLPRWITNLGGSKEERPDAVDLSSLRAVFLIDGNNWDHGLKHLGIERARRLDYQRLARKLAQERKVRAIRYYVGRVLGEEPWRVQRQKQFVTALQQQKVQVHLGKVQQNPMRLTEREQRASLVRLFEDRADEIPEDLLENLREYRDRDESQFVEKQVDTKIAVDLVDLAHRDEYDVAYLLSADADFVPAVKVARRLGKTVFAVSPLPGLQLLQAVNTYIRIRADFFDDIHSS